MIEVKVTAPTAPELSALVKSLAAQFGVNLPTAQAEMVAEVEKETIVEEVKVVEEKPKKGNAKKASTKSVDAEEVSTAETVQADSATSQTTEQKPQNLSKQDIADACQKVSAAKNLDAAKAILAQFKNEKGEACRRISDVLEADYAAFVSKCEEAIK